jgi:hypothetical protein
MGSYINLKFKNLQVRISYTLHYILGNIYYII